MVNFFARPRSSSLTLSSLIPRSLATALPPVGLPPISQETLAEMIGTTRSHGKFFMNKFRKLGFIKHHGGLHIHDSTKFRTPRSGLTALDRSGLFGIRSFDLLQLSAQITC
jgi:Crp-like helix-turn-helix domain